MLPILPNTPPDSRVWRIVQMPGVELVLAVIFVVVAYVLVGVLTFFTVGQYPSGWAAVVPGAFVAALFLAGYTGFVRLIERRPVAELWSAGWPRELGGGFLAGLGLFSLIVAAIGLMGGYRVIGHHGAAVLLPVIGMALTSGVSEEIIFRGLFFRLVERALGSWVALILSAAFFGAAHLANPNASPVAGAAIAVEAGVMLAAFYMVTRRLWAVMGLHAAWNFAQGGIFGIPVSGFSFPGLLVPRMAGPDWLTGAAFGAEASMPAVVIATAFGVAMLAVAWRQDRFVAPFWRRQGAVAAQDHAHLAETFG